MAAAEPAEPGWFTRALSTPGTSGFAQVEGCAIHYLRWGDPSRAGLLLVPPTGGHAHWFDHVAPLFADQFHVVAMDPSGCGDSGRRQAYAADLVTQEILGVCAHAGLFAARVAPTLVGHSASAPVAVRTALAHGERLLGVVAVDGLRYARLEKDPAIKALEGPRPAPRPARLHPTLEAAAARFRLTPTPLIEVANGDILDHIARHSYGQADGGWTAKYDPAQGATVSLAFDLLARLGELACPAAAIYAEHSHLADETAADAIAAASCGRVAAFRIPGASHYPMIDSPFAYVAAVKGVVLAWIAEAARLAPGRG